MINRIFKPERRYTQNTYLFLLIIFCIFLCSCSFSSMFTGKTEKVSKSGFYLNTIITITLYDTEDTTVIDDCFSLCAEYESVFSRTDPNSELYQVNHSEETIQRVSVPLYELIKIGLSYYELSDGLFDITVAPLSDLWNFSSNQAMVPAEEDIKKTCEFVNGSLIHLTEQGKLVRDNSSVRLDLGGLAKGYIADRVKELLISKGVKSAVIDLGGNVLVVGEKKGGASYQIGIRTPFSTTDDFMLTLSVKDCTVVTSGTYERGFTTNGIRYHHILNPSTGYPYQNGLSAVTIICPDSVDGDGLSTTCFALGVDKGLELVNSLDGVYAIFVNADNTLTYSNGVKDLIS